MRSESSGKSKDSDEDEGQVATETINHKKDNNNVQSHASKSASSDMVKRNSTRKGSRDAAAAVVMQSQQAAEDEEELGVANSELLPLFAAPKHRRKHKHKHKAAKTESPLVEDNCDDICNSEATHTSNSKVLMWLSTAKNESPTVDVNSTKTIAAKPLQEVVNSGDGGEGKRRRRLRAFSKHWLSYPKVIIGVIGEVTAQCNEVELKARLEGALKDHTIEQKSFSCCVDDHEVSSTTLRRYVNMVKTMLEYAIGADEVPPEVHAFLTPDTEFAVLKRKIDLNIAHCKRKCSEQSDDELPAKIQRGKAEINKKEKSVKEVVKSEKVSVSGPNENDGETLKQQTVPPLVTSSASQESSQMSAVASVTKLSSTSPFFPRAKTGVGRRSFCGTVDDLRAEVLKILEERMEDSGNIKQLVDITTNAIVKEVSLRNMMDRAGLPLKMLLSSYALCGRYMALDKVELVDNNDNIIGASALATTANTSTMTALPSALKATVGGARENCPVNTSREKATKGVDHENYGRKKWMRTIGEDNTCDGSFAGNTMLRELCAKLVDAFVVNQGDLARLKCAIDYMVQYGYKRSENDKKQLRDLLEAVLIDGISIQSALEESPGFKRVVVTEYSNRCNKIYNYMSSLSCEPDFEDDKTVAKKVEAFTKTLFS